MKFSASDSLPSEPDKRRNVVSEDDSGLARRPFKHRAIVDTGQSDILSSHNVDTSGAPQEPAKNVVVQVLVGEEPNHSGAAWERRARRRARMPAEG
jgi:hypothetical protein